jgi:ABC-type branched-subunit amino acid transport system ATPase component
MGAFVRSDDQVGQRKQQIFELFPRLHERRRQKAGKMSGGERQMVAMGSALMLDPKLILLDEPSAGLAPKMVDHIFERIVHVNREFNIAVMMVEQNAKQSLQMAHRGYVMASGENRVEGTGEELLNDPDVARLYLGG